MPVCGIICIVCCIHRNCTLFLVPWLKRHLAGAGVTANVLKLSGGNSTQFKDEAMELFKTRYVMP